MVCNVSSATNRLMLGAAVGRRGGVACPVGRRGAHQLVNESAEPLRVLVVSTMVYPDMSWRGMSSS